MARILFAVSNEPRITNSFPWWLRPFLQRSVVAITLGRRIYVSARVTGEHLERLLRHEIAHVHQVNRLGAVRFYWRYVREYIALRRSGLKSYEAYRKISFEEEATAAEELV
ncbi:MAG: hypothetical protein ACXVIJ_02140 [Thermoanaerobaculia bacterium]